MLWSLVITTSLVMAVAVYVAASAALFVFGVNLTWLSFVAWRRRDQPVLAPSTAGPLPFVTIQLPLYNELFVARRAIEAASRIDYPKHLLQIQVLDDSDDETSIIVVEAVAAARSAGIEIDHIQRRERTGFKAGALAAGLDQARGSLTAVFDADFVPPADFLTRTVPHFADPSVAFVQARWGHLNAKYSWLTRLQVPAIDGHFHVEQRARGIKGCWFNFNGTAGIWRVEAIRDAGGWQTDTLTEDLDLSYRVHLKGWRGIFLPDLVVPGELPAQLSGFRRQQHRWARGSLECAAKLLGPVWRSDASRATKFQASIHLLAYSVHLLLLLFVLTYPAVVVAMSRLAMTSPWLGLGHVLALASLAPAIFLLTGQFLELRGQPRSVGRRLPTIMALVIFGSGMMVNTARAALDIFIKPDPVFERTAKFGLDGADGEGRSWMTTRYQRGLDRIAYVEAGLGFYAVASAVFAWRHGSWGVVVYVLLFGTGLLTVSGASMVQAIGLRRRQRRARYDRTSSGPSSPSEQHGTPSIGPSSSTWPTIGAQ